MLEVAVSTAILAIGLLGIAVLITNLLTMGSTSRYMAMANVLASEKLDNLNKWPSNSLNVQPGGALTGPSTCAAGDIYCDQVTVSETSGADYETQTQYNDDGTVTSTTLVHTSAGCVNTPAVCGVAQPAAGASTFTRRWLITTNPVVTPVGGGAGQTITGARRVSVVVFMTTQMQRNPVSFQLSMVRP